MQAAGENESQYSQLPSPPLRPGGRLGVACFVSLRPARTETAVAASSGGFLWNGPLPKMHLHKCDHVQF